eukprot:TRINITY_DN56729_c0_g1_i1.p1 TRINITY_DN56729_c0_g1~~TRINITY_DN56729_c0_g1_i1.p1  ORF type:complete len:243 (-),score=25.52 TRINITY_DN56729_c0_g1_i1:168-896(-)
MALLDDTALARVLQFTRDPVGRLCCKAWASYLYESLHLQAKIALRKALHEQQQLFYMHSTVRDLGGMEECVSFSFTFAADCTYSLQWFREGLTSDNEQQYGAWCIAGDKVRCETRSASEEPDERYLRVAPAGRVFELPVHAVLAGSTTADQTPEDWELPARGLPPDRSTNATPASHGTSASIMVPHVHDQLAAEPVELARFVEIDGEAHEVSRDIVANWPEADWPRIMRCRLRFGTGAERWP